VLGEGQGTHQASVRVAWRMEEIAAMRGIDVEEDTRDDDRLLLQKLLEERLTRRTKINVSLHFLREVVREKRNVCLQAHCCTAEGDSRGSARCRTCWWGERAHLDAAL
jgi:hypothetical protein